MNRKTQVVAIREVLHFGIGLLLLVSVILLFNNIKPIVEDFALQRHVENINSHVNYLLTSIIQAGDSIATGSLSATYSLPDKLGDYDYTVYISGSELCTRLVSRDISDCLGLLDSSPDFNGVYMSGGNLEINLNKTLTGTSIILSN